MDSMARLVERQGESVAVEMPAEPARGLTATAVYHLSEEGRKTSLLAGGDGKAVQQIELQVPASRLHLVSVDRQGIARLKLHPRFDRDGERGIVRLDSAPLYDAPPTVEDLYRAAARNHELESAYSAERSAERMKRRESDRETRENVAASFLADKSQRALTHPAPSPKRCALPSPRGNIRFDVATDVGIAKEVPSEAHRRFRRDLQERREHNQQERVAQLALHEEKRRFVEDWIKSLGTDDQKRRQAAGVLSLAEGVEAITDSVFSPLADSPRYAKDGVQRLRGLRATTSDSAPLTTGDLLVTTVTAKAATSAQWKSLEDIKARVPDATTVLKRHRLSLKTDAATPSVDVFAVLVTLRHGPLTLRREYSAPAD